MISDQITRTALRAQAAGITSGTAPAELRAWVEGNVSSDVLAAMVRTSYTPGSLAWHVARLAGCPHERGTCTGILARRGYSGHHSATLYGGAS